LGFPTPFPLALVGYSVLAVVSLAEYHIPNPAINKLSADDDCLGVFSAYPAVLTLLAKQLLKILPVNLIDRLATEVF